MLRRTSRLPQPDDTPKVECRKKAAYARLKPRRGAVLPTRCFGGEIHACVAPKLDPTWLDPCRAVAAGLAAPSGQHHPRRTLTNVGTPKPARGGFRLYCRVFGLAGVEPGAALRQPG